MASRSYVYLYYPPTSTPATPTTTTTPDPVAKALTDTGETSSDALASINTLVYNTLKGDVVLNPIATQKALKLSVDQTIILEGFGKFLSGRYYLSNIKKSINATKGFQITLTVIKTGFADNVKSPDIPIEDTVVRPDEVEKVVASFKVNGSVRVVGDSAVYTNGVIIPEWVKQSTYTISQISTDGTKVLLKEIFSWVSTAYLRTAE